ncbi:MAG TPA: hypothetical protein VFG69_18890 [Nannocystaceae bacterium]|nr:hypothetical protein [Nannocystaceae bacterium]
MTEDPRRLLDSDATSSTLRRDLSNARAAVPDYDVAAGVARFEASLASLPATDDAPAGGEPIAAAKTSTTWWILGGSAVAAAAVAWSIGRDPVREPIAAEREAPAVVEPRASEPAPASAPIEPPPLVTPPAPTPPVAELPASSVARKRSPAKSPAPRESDDDALAREMAATAAAKRALATDPARALELVAAADREFPGSVYEEDREGIAVLALAKLGHSDRARVRGEAYLSAHPKGSYADRIRSVLGQGESTAKKP